MIKQEKGPVRGIEARVIDMDFEIESMDMTNLLAYVRELSPETREIVKLIAEKARNASSGQQERVTELLTRIQIDSTQNVDVQFALNINSLRLKTLAKLNAGIIEYQRMKKDI